jgi:hypothetical protein
MTRQSTARRLFVLLPASLAVCSLAGCALFGALASKVVPEPTIAPQYTGLRGQSVAVMVWAPEGTLIDFPDVRLDVAGSLQKKLEQAAAAKTKAVAGVSFPTPAASVVRLQDNSPELEATPLAEVAPRLGARRVIYLEIENLQTRSDASVELFRGSASATVKVVEVSDGQGTVAFEESGVAAVFPPNAREEGMLEGNDELMYSGVVDQLTTEIAKRFVPHKEDQ